MNRLSIQIKDDKKLKIVLNLLKELPFVEVKREPVERTAGKARGRIADIFGIWGKREITLKNIRQKAWDRS